MIRVVISVLIYGLLFMISERLSDFAGIPYIVVVPVISAYLLIVLLLMKKDGVLKKYKISRFPKTGRCLLLLTPLFAVPAMNLCSMNPSGPAAALEAQEILRVLFLGISAFSEELLFRAVLPALLSERCRLSLIQSTVTVNAMFALMHLGNALTGLAPGTAAVQAVLAMGIGLCFSGITEKTNSLFPAVCMHWLIDLSDFRGDLYRPALPFKELLIWSGISVLSIIYGLMLIRSNKREVA